MLRRANNDSRPDKLRRGTIPRIRGAVHTAVFHALHRVGLFGGCIIANLLTGNIFDIVFGSLATLAAALITAEIGRRGHDLGRKILACLMPVLFNAVVVGAVITSAYNGLNIFSHPAAFGLNAAQVGLGEAAVLFVIGLPMMYYLPGLKFFREFTIKLND